MRVITVTQSGSGVTGGRRTQVIVSRTGPPGASGGAGTIGLDDLTDVSLVGTTSGDFLRYDGTAWTDTKIVASDLGTGTANAFSFLAGDLTWQHAVPLDVEAKNTTASTIPKGTPVYITGSVGSGHTVEVAPANAASSGTMAAIGLTVTNLTANATGYVRTMGVLEGVSTGAYSINQTLFVASGGGLTNVRPTGTTTLVQNIGRVMRANNNTGTVLIMGPGRTNDVPNRIATTYLADGTAGASNYLRGDQTWSSITAADVSAVPTSRLVNTSTGLAGGGDLSADRTLSVLYGTTAGSAAQGNDARLSDARTPTTHATSHQDGGSDELALDASQVTTGTVATARLGSGTASANTFLRGDQTYQPVPVGNNDMGRVSNACYLTGSGAYFGGLGATQGNTMSTPDAAALDLTGDLEMVARVNLPDYTTGAAHYLLGKWGATTDGSYYFYVTSVGNLGLAWYESGGTLRTASPAINPGLFVDGTTYWVKGTLAVNVGGQYEVKFYYAADSSTEPSSWTQWGATVTGSTGASSVRTGNGVLSIGALGSISTSAVGTIYRTILRSGIGGTTVFDANFATATADALAFTESSSNAATVTITTTRYSYGIPNGQMAAQTTLTATINTVYYAPFEVTAPITLDAMAFNLNASPAANGNVRMGVYAADSNLQPTGAPLFDSGDVAITTSTTGVVLKQGTPATLQPGVYLSAFNTGTAVTLRVATGGMATINTGMGAAMYVSTLTAAQTQGAFPSPGTAWTTRGSSSTGTVNLTVMRWR
jgi:hypothetical protein